MGNGAKAQQKRDRNAKDTKKGPTTQLKANAAAQTIKCKKCFQTFQSTTNKQALEEHAGKHTMTYDACFAA
ncbi:hypothetical protein ANO11243_055800 [Dothideomycetidae sp. 11243]|nr:hypothetical protein ANO11243_055800 [fungal sp. No.11243]